jgi:hypothetical protein
VKLPADSGTSSAAIASRVGRRRLRRGCPRQVLRVRRGDLAQDLVRRHEIAGRDALRCCDVDRSSWAPLPTCDISLDDIVRRRSRSSTGPVRPPVPGPCYIVVTTDGTAHRSLFVTSSGYGGRLNAPFSAVQPLVVTRHLTGAATLTEPPNGVRPRQAPDR